MQLLSNAAIWIQDQADSLLRCQLLRWSWESTETGQEGEAMSGFEKNLDYESLWARLADKAMAKRRAIESHPTPRPYVKVNWVHFHLKYKGQWIRVSQAAMLAGCSRSGFVNRITDHAKCYDRKVDAAGRAWVRCK